MMGVGGGVGTYHVLCQGTRQLLGGGCHWCVVVGVGCVAVGPVCVRVCVCKVEGERD